MPVDAEILEVNEQLLETPEAVNTDAYGEGWMVKVRLDGDDKDLLLLKHTEKLLVQSSEPKAVCYL